MNTDITPLVRKLLGINWRTTIGAFIPLLSALLIVATAISKGELPSTDQLYVVGGALSLAWTAIFAKDKSTTGGTVPATPEAAMRTGVPLNP
jgi:drug/metabolite transporter (DMT)-like permease